MRCHVVVSTANLLSCIMQQGECESEFGVQGRIKLKDRPRVLSVDGKELNLVCRSFRATVKNSTNIKTQNVPL